MFLTTRNKTVSLCACNEHLHGSLRLKSGKQISHNWFACVRIQTSLIQYNVQIIDIFQLLSVIYRLYWLLLWTHSNVWFMFCFLFLFFKVIRALFLCRTWMGFMLLWPFGHFLSIKAFTKHWVWNLSEKSNDAYKTNIVYRLWR